MSFIRENFIYQCSKCKKKFNTSGPWEFYRNKKGNRIPFGHPGPINKEAQLSGVDGLFADMLCLDCGKEVNIIIEEYYKQPAHSKGFKDFLAFLFGKIKEDDDKPRCPNCKGDNLFLSNNENAEKNEKVTMLTCPNCSKGKLELIDHWIP